MQLVYIDSDRERLRQPVQARGERAQGGRVVPGAGDETVEPRLQVGEFAERRRAEARQGIGGPLGQHRGGPTAVAGLQFSGQGGLQVGRDEHGEQALGEPLGIGAGPPGRDLGHRLEYPVELPEQDAGRGIGRQVPGAQGAHVGLRQPDQVRDHSRTQPILRRDE